MVATNFDYETIYKLLRAKYKLSKEDLEDLVQDAIVMLLEKGLNLDGRLIYLYSSYLILNHYKKEKANNRKIEKVINEYAEQLRLNEYAEDLSLEEILMAADLTEDERCLIYKKLMGFSWKELGTSRKERAEIRNKLSEVLGR